MKLIDQSIRNYHSVTVVMALVAVVGVICFNTLPRQLTPTVDKPLIEVRTEYPGLSPNEVERNITRRLEEQLESVEGLKKKPLAQDALGRLYIDDPTDGEQYGKVGYHMTNFMECVKSRKTPASDMLTHHRMLNVCHAINIAMRLNRRIVFDPKTERFGDDSLANSFIEREQRKGYEVRA